MPAKSMLNKKPKSERCAMTTLNEAIEVLNKVKREFAAARQQWKERENELLAQVRAEKNKHVPKANQEPVVQPPSRKEVETELLKKVINTLDLLRDKHKNTVAAWEKMTKEERTKSEQSVRVWAHPFIGIMLDAVRDEILKV